LTISLCQDGVGNIGAVSSKNVTLLEVYSAATVSKITEIG